MESKAVESSKEFQEQALDMNKLKHCFECGICTASCPVVEIIPNYYNPRILLEQIILDLDEALEEKALWLCAWCYGCQKKCPQGLKLPEIFLPVRKIAVERGNLQGFESAYETIGREIPLPIVCSLVCFHPERAQVNETTIDKTIKRSIIDYRSKQKALTKLKLHEEKIAIVGSGPAGLAAAWELVRMGFQVTVFEALSEPGGMLRVGIPGYRLPREVLDMEIDYIKNLGVEIRTNITIGRDLAFNSLLEEYESVFIATGAHRSRKLHVEGEDIEGVVNALDLLHQANLQKRPRPGEKVGVVGGGNTAIDVARVALRLGAKDVNILYRRSREEMPANPLEVEEAEREGVKIDFLLTPRKILGKNKQVVAMECVRMRLGPLDERGRRRPIPIEGSDFTMELDTTILAIGESPDVSFLPEEFEITEQNTIVVDSLTLETSMSGVFAGGDVVSGPATVIEAIAAGKRAAFSIENYLKAKKNS